MEFRRRLAIILVVSIVISSSSFDLTSVYATENNEEDSILVDNAYELVADELEDKLEDETILEADSVLSEDDISILNNETDIPDSIETLTASKVKVDGLDSSEDYVYVSLSKDGLYKSNNGFSFTIDEKNKAAVKSWTGSGVAKIPALIIIEEEYRTEIHDDGKRNVEIIGASAFSTCGDTLSSVQIPSSIKEIQKLAFENCSSLESITIPDSVTAIGESAFMNCSALDHIDLSNKLTNLGKAIFYGCTSLSQLNIPNSLNETATVTGGALSGAVNLKKFTFADDTKKLANNLFSGCDSLESIDLPSTLTDIGEKTFYTCNNLVTVTMPESLTGIGKNAFQNCKSLSVIGSAQYTESGEIIRKVSENTIEIPKYIINIGDEAFSECASLKKVLIPRSISSLGDKAFYNCKNISELTFTDGVAGIDYRKKGTIGNQAFYNCENIPSLFVPQTFATVGNSAFANCMGMKTLSFDNIYDKATGGSIGIKAFYNCKELTKAVISDNYELIDESAFEDCSKLEEVILLNEYKNNTNGKIGRRAFYNCEKLKKINISDHFTEIADYAFAYCGKLGLDGTEYVTIVIPDTIKIIGPCAFLSCISLKNITLSKNLEQIGNAAFKKCETLDDVKLPKSIKNVITEYTWNKNRITNSITRNPDPAKEKEGDGGVFCKCTNLKKVEFEDGIVTIIDNILNDTGYLEAIKIPNTVTRIGKAAFKDCVKLKEIIYEDTSIVTTIDNEAFRGCIILDNRSKDGRKYSVMPDSLNTLGDNAYYGCIKLARADIPNGTEKVGTGAFKGCEFLEEAVIPDTATTIGASSFEGCEKLRKVTLPANMKTIPAAMFKNCEALSDNVLPLTLESIGNNAFENCQSITGLDFTKHSVLSTIGESAFNNCNKLAIVKLSDSTNVMGNSAFKECDELVEIQFGTGLKTIPSYAFADLGKITEIVIPRNVTTIKDYAFSNDINLTKAHISKDTSIEPDAFWFVDNLTIYGVEGSEAETYAKTHKMGFVPEPVPVESIRFLTDSKKLQINHTFKFLEDIKVEIKPVNYTEDIVFRSSDDSILSIDNSMTVKGVSKGVAEIRASVSGNSSVSSAAIKVYVMEGVREVKLNKTSEKLYPGDTVQLEVEVIPYDAIDTSVTWSVEKNKEDIVTVDSTGLVTAHKPGTAKITVTSNNEKKTKTCTITVEKEPELDPNTPCSLSADIIHKPVASVVSGTTIAKGTIVKLMCDVPGANIYYTTNGSLPRADWTGKVTGGTELYKGGIVVNDDVTIKAFAIREGYHNSDVATFIYAIDKWGDIEDDLHEKFDGRKIPSGIWYCFDGDDTIYEKSDKVIQTKIVKESTGLNQNFSNEIHVYYGNRKLYEKRDYTVSYKNSKKPAKASDEKPPTFTIKGTGTYSGTSTFAYTIEGDAKVVSSKGIKVACLNKSPIYTGNPLTLADLYKTDNKHSKITLYKGSTDLVEGTDYDIDTTVFAPSGTFNVLFKLKGNYTGYITQKVTVKPYDIKKDTSNKIRIEFAKDNGTTPYSQAGSTPAVSVWFGNERLTEGVDYTLKYNKNKKVSDTAKVVVKGKGMFKGSRDETFSVVQKPVGEDMELYLKDVVETASAGKFISKPVVWDNGVKVKASYIAKYDVSDCTFYDVTNGKTLTSKDAPKAKTLIKVTLKVKSSNNKSPYTGEGNVVGYFKIIENNKDISKATVTLTNNRKSLPFNDGNEVVPLSETDLVVTLKDAQQKDYQLKASDYEITSITKNKVIGTATVTLRGKGQYGGTKTYKLKIAKKTF